MRSSRREEGEAALLTSKNVFTIFSGEIEG